MEVSSFASGCVSFRHCASEELLLKMAWSPNWNQLRLSPVARGLRPLVGQTGILIWKKNNLQVLHCRMKEGPVIHAGCMDQIYKTLAERLIPTSAAESNPNFKHIIGLCGPPGAGKSTVASEVVRYVNELWPQKSSYFGSQVESPEVAISIPMDGFHLYRHQLDAMQNPEEAHARRGSPWTFDPERLLRCLRKLKTEGSVYVPSFDHGVGDPVEDDILVNLQHKIVIVEGNYLLLDEGAWRDISCIFDEKWFIDVDIEKSMERVLKRHISTGKPPDVAKWRINYNDRPNAELIMKSKQNADLIIRSVDFSSDPTLSFENGLNLIPKYDHNSQKGNLLDKLIAPKASQKGNLLDKLIAPKASQKGNLLDKLIAPKARVLDETY